MLFLFVYPLIEQLAGVEYSIGIKSFFYFLHGLAYLPRNVERIPPRDPEQEYLPPPGARPEPEVVAEGIRVLDVKRSSDRFRLSYEASSAGSAKRDDIPGGPDSSRGGPRPAAAIISRRLR